MGVTWRITDENSRPQRRAKDFVARMGRIPLKVRLRINQANEKSAEELAAMMRRLVPVDERDLERSIVYYELKSAADMVWRVAAGDETAYYARWVEFGNGTTPARPFFYASYRGLRRLIKNRQLRAFRQGLKDSDT
jgi:hypothetical protein